MTAEALFALGPDAVPPRPAAEPLSAGRRLTLRQAADLAAGRHPLAGAPLHPDAAPADNRNAPGLRCGSCRFRVLAGRRGWPKCDRPGAPVSNGAATDVRAWWPGCAHHQPQPDHEA